MSANFHPLVYIIDYILGVIMWTLIGRVAMNIFQKEDSQFFFMKEFVKFTNPLITSEPNAATQKMVDEVRVPSGKSILGKQH